MTAREAVSEGNILVEQICTKALTVSTKQCGSERLRTPSLPLIQMSNGKTAVVDGTPAFSMRQTP